MHFFCKNQFVEKSGYQPKSVLILLFTDIRHILRHGGKRASCRMTRHYPVISTAVLMIFDVVDVINVNYYTYLSMIVLGSYIQKIPFSRFTFKFSTYVNHIFMYKDWNVHICFRIDLLRNKGQIHEEICYNFYYLFHKRRWIKSDIII